MQCFVIFCIRFKDNYIFLDILEQSAVILGTFMTNIFLLLGTENNSFNLQAIKGEIFCIQVERNRIVLYALISKFVLLTRNSCLQEI